MNTKKELSYFRLKLEAFLQAYHPEKINDKVFISARSNEALTVYADSIADGQSHLQAEELATATLFQGLDFSSYSTLVHILEEEFSQELPKPLPTRLAPILLKNKAIQKIFQKYPLSDKFEDSTQYDELYTELTGAIALLIERNALPTAKS